MTPAISVVIAAVPGGRLSECLESLRSQVNPEEIEVIVAGDRDVIASLVESIDWARFVETVGGATISRLLGTGIKASTGEIVAITDSSCVVAEDWIREIKYAHQSQHQTQGARVIIGGAVEIDGQPRAVEWAAYFCEYAQFMLPLVAGPAREIPGNNLTFHREALEDAAMYVHPEFWKSYWCGEMRKLGAQIVASSAIVVRQQKRYEPRAFLVRRFNHGRCFAGMRLAGSPLLRVVYGSGSLLLPFLLTGRVISIMLTRRRYLREFCLSFHYVLLAVLAWSLGELCGYFGGAGKSCSRLW